MNLPYTRKDGGANKSNRLLAETLAKQGVVVTVVTPAFEIVGNHNTQDLLNELTREGIEAKIERYKFVFSINGVQVNAVSDPAHLYESLKSEIAAFNPDWIFVSTEDPSQLLFKAAYEASPKRIIYLAHTHYMLPFGPLSFYPGTKRTDLIKKAKAVFAISNYVADYIKKYADIPAFVHHPPHYNAGVRRLGFVTNSYILMINPCPVKGISILLELATALPHRQFAVVPGWGTTSFDVEELGKYENITFLEKTKDLDQLFAEVSLLLMPSLWQEAFGMSVVDALARGIPVISSNTGGLGEAKLGTNFQINVHPIERFTNEFDENGFPRPLVPLQDITLWKNAVETLLSDPLAYSQESELSYNRASAFISTLSIKPLLLKLSEMKEQKKAIRFDQFTEEEKFHLLQKLKLKKQSATDRLYSIRAIEKRQYYDVSYQQKQLLLIDEIEKGFYGFIIGDIVELNEAIDVETLNKAFRFLFQRHEALRTHFIKIKGEYKQQIVDHVVFMIKQVDLSDHPQKKSECQKCIEDILISRFEVSTAPLLRAILITLGKERFLFAFAVHHLISDGVSIQILTQELLEGYRAIAGGSTRIQRISFKTQYKDYVRWQNEFISNKAYSTNKMYWAERLKDGVPVLELPIDFPRPAVKNFIGKKIRFDFSRRQSDAIASIGQKYGTGFFITLVSLIKILLFRYTNQEDIIVGVPVTGRKSESLRYQIGFYVNLLVLRSSISPNSSFANFLKYMKESVTQAYDNDDYPFYKLVEEFDKKRDISRAPLFDVMISLKHVEVTANTKKTSNLNGPIYDSDLNVGSSHDLAFLFVENSGEISLIITYNPILFKDVRIQRMGDHFQQLLTSVTENNSIAINDIDLLTPAERNSLLYGFVAKKGSYPSRGLIHEQFERMTEQFPGKIACKVGNAHLTYYELNKKANQLAAELRTRGVRRNDIVAVIAGRSFEMIICIMGILKSGGCYLPIDPSFPPERIRYMIENSESKFILASPDTKSYLTSLASENTFWIDDPKIQAHNGRNLDLVNVPNDNCYVIYTSGSTGLPKGVLVRHFNVMRLFFTETPLFDFTPNDRWSLFHSFSFDFSVWEMYGALLFGGAVVLVEEAVAKNTSEFLLLLIDEQITILNQVPGAFQNLSELHMNLPAVQLTVRYIIFGGDMLYPIMLKSWKDRHPACKLINMYGITETTVHVTFKELTDYEINANLSIIGKALPTLHIYILDKNQRLLPIGCYGEICISGDGLSKGYIKDQELTNQKFIPNPYEKGELMFRSGDLGRYLDNGELEYLGRMDNQVQLRGYRIELKEIEHRIQQFKGIDAAVVAVHKDKNMESTIIAYILSKHEYPGYIRELQEYVLRFLPRYMMPAFFIKVDKMPLTSNGKIDRKSLPDPNILLQEKMPVPPSNELEEKLFKIWQEVLLVDNFGVEDNFFEIGGHSIKAVKVTALIHKKIQSEIRLGIFFENPTIRELANFISTDINIGMEPGINQNEIEVFI